jgi:hypothetical protein
MAEEATPAEPQAPDTLTIAFTRPIEFAGDTYRDLVLREPTVAEMERVENLVGIASTIELMRMISGRPESVIRAMGISQLREASGYLQVFTQGARWRPARA